MNGLFEYFWTHAYLLIPYVLLVFIFVALYSSGVLFKVRIFKYFAILLLIFFSGFKEAMSPDLTRYSEMFQNSSVLSIKYIEPGFVIITKALKLLSGDYHLLFFTYAFLTILFLCLAIKKLTPYVGFSLLIYLIIPGYFLNTFVEIRQMLAVSIFLFATTFLIKENNRLKFVLWSIISAMFHYSAIIAFLIIFFFDILSLYKFLHKKTTRLLLILIMLLSILIPPQVIKNLIGLLIINLIPKYSGYFEAYLGHNTTENVPILKLLIYNLLGLFVLYFRNFHLPASFKYPKELDYMLGLFIIGIIFINIFREFQIFTRICYFLLIYQIIILPDFIIKAHLPRELKYIFIFLLILFYFSQYIYGLFYISPETGTLLFLPYKNIILEVLKWHFTLTDSFTKALG